jgi:seryl-tRNA synthetase
MKIPIQYAVTILIVAFVIGCVKQSTHEEVLEKLKAKESEKNQVDSFLMVAKEEGSKNKTELKLLTDQLQQTKIEKEEISRKLKNESSSYQSALEKTEVQQKEITELKKHLDEYENGYDRSVSII